MPTDSSVGSTETLELKIADVSRGGSGVGRDASGRAVFVPFTAPGDQVEVEIENAAKRYANARLIRVIESGEVRRDPLCPVFGECGGCEWQHLPYDLQWNVKLKGIAEALKRIKVEPVSSTIEEFPADQTYGYRNRIQLRGDGHEMGFYRRGSNTVVDVPKGCAVARDEINGDWDKFRSRMKKVAADTGKEVKLEVELSLNKKITQTENQAHGAAGFRQVNDAQNGQLRQWVAKNLGTEKWVLDLFGGQGNLSDLILDSVDQIQCVDLSVPKESNHAKRRFFKSDVAQWLKRQKDRSQTPKVALLDPPREGLGKHHTGFVRAFEHLSVQRIVAVGCDVDSWARDLSRWTDNGFVVEKVAAFDFFPQTHHVEAAAVLLRRS